LDLPESQLSCQRPQRSHRLPARYRDNLPEPAPAIESDENVDSTYQRSGVLPRVRLIVRDSMRTIANTFGLFREYQHRPTYDPDSTVPASNLAYAPQGTTMEDGLDNDTAPTPSSSTNITTELLLNWQNSGSELKSHGEVNRLVKEVLCHPDFAVKDLKGFEAARENRKQDQRDEKYQAGRIPRNNSQD
jgi:hypothetical protein